MISGRNAVNKHDIQGELDTLWTAIVGLSNEIDQVAEMIDGESANDRQKPHRIDSNALNNTVCYVSMSDV